MAVITMKQLLEVGAHFGHQAKRWNPKMKPYIFTERNGIHILDLHQTLAATEKAYEFVREISSEGGKVLFVGTKKQAQDAVKEEAERAGGFYVNHRWLGGLLTNLETIKKRVKRLKELEEMEADGTLDTAYTKKEAGLLRKEMAKLSKNIGGIKEMKKLPAALFVVDIKKEFLALEEAKKLGISVKPVGKDYDEIKKLAKSTPMVLGGGHCNPMNVDMIYDGRFAKITGWSNVIGYSNAKTDEYIEKAFAAKTDEEANEYWQKVSWDGTEGPSVLGETCYIPVCYIRHLYFVRDGIDLGRDVILAHDHGTASLQDVIHWDYKAAN